MRADPARWRVRPPRAASGLRRVRGGSVREDGIWRECPPRASHGLQFLAWESSASQAKGHVLVDGHMRVERVVLEHHRDIAIPRKDIVQEAAIEIDLPPVISSK